MRLFKRIAETAGKSVRPKEAPAVERFPSNAEMGYRTGRKPSDLAYVNDRRSGITRPGAVEIIDQTDPRWAGWRGLRHHG